LSALCLMLAAICSIEAEASSVPEACSVEPCDSVSALADSSRLPDETFSAAPAVSVITARRRSTMVFRALPVSSFSDCGLTSTVRSPPAILPAISAIPRKVLSVVISEPASSSPVERIFGSYERSPTEILCIPAATLRSAVMTAIKALPRSSFSECTVGSRVRSPMAMHSATEALSRKALTITFVAMPSLSTSERGSGS
jgi:hypothetical protein